MAARGRSGQHWRAGWVSLWLQNQGSWLCLWESDFADHMSSVLFPAQPVSRPEPVCCGILLVCQISKGEGTQGGRKYMSKAPCDRGASPGPSIGSLHSCHLSFAYQGPQWKRGSSHCMVPGGISLPCDPTSALLSVLHTYSCPFCDITSGAKGGRERGDNLQAGAFPLCSSGKPDCIPQTSSFLSTHPLTELTRVLPHHGNHHDGAAL